MPVLSSLKQMFRKASLLSMILSLVFVSVALAASGDLDTAFSGDGMTDTGFGINSPDSARAVAIQPNGRIVVVGYTGPSASSDFAIARYNQNGTLDTSFSGDGMQTTSFDASDVAWAVAIQTDGKIVVSGYACDAFLSDCSVAVARYLSNGSLDTSFSGDGKQTAKVGTNPTQSIGGLAIQTDGKIVVAGHALIGATFDFAAFRFNTNGSLDTSFSGDGKVSFGFGSGRTDSGVDLALQSDGKIVLVGHSSDSGNTSENFAVARLTSTGSLDSTFSGDGKQMVNFGASTFANGNSVAIDGNGKIVIAGSKKDGPVTVFALTRLNSNGALDATFNGTGKVIVNLPGPTDIARSVVFDGTKIVIAGESRPASIDFALLRFNANGSLDTSFSGDGVATFNFGSTYIDQAWGVAIDSNGRYVLAGHTNQGGSDNFGVVRVLP